ncbi:DeoR family transcriptional regulator (plasmid) [Rhizobium leguminosarum]
MTKACVPTLTSERKALILETLGTTGRVVAKELSLTLGLSEDTIRRDLRELASEGLLQRVHGAALPASKALADLPSRRKISVEDKTESQRRRQRRLGMARSYSWMAEQAPLRWPALFLCNSMRPLSRTAPI